jgi:RNA polymerase sigma-B factor
METLSFTVAPIRPQARSQRKCATPEPVHCQSEAPAQNRFAPELIRIAQGLDAAVRSLKAELRRAPTLDEIGVRVGASREQVIEGIEVRAATKARGATRGGLSRQSVPGTTQESACGTRVEKLDLSFEGKGLRNAVQDLLPTLSTRSRNVVKLRVMENRSSAEIARSTGMSVEHVCRLLDETWRYCIRSTAESL